MKSKAILLVEDDYSLRQTIKIVLASSGFTVDTACNGQEALRYLNQHGTPALMLLDMMMPVMNGPELLDKLIQEGRHNDFPIVILSAVADDEVANPYKYPAIVKPVRMQTLLDLAKQHCGTALSPDSTAESAA